MYGIFTYITINIDQMQVNTSYIERLGYIYDSWVICTY